MAVVLVYFFPISCILFVVNLVEIMKKIHQGEMNTYYNTLWATIGLILIIGSIIATQGA